MDSFGNWLNTLMSGFSAANDIGRKQRERYAPMVEALTQSRQAGEAQSPFSAESFANAAARTLADFDYQNQAWDENWGDYFKQRDERVEEGQRRAKQAPSSYQDMINNQTLYPTMGEDALLYGSPEEMSAFSFLAPQSPQESEQAASEQSPEPKERSETWGMNQGPNALKRAWDANDVPWDPGYGSNMSIEDLQAAGVNVAEDPYEDAKKVTGIPRHVDNLGSMREEFYDWMLNSEAGREFALAHPEFAVENNGYTRFRELADPNLYAEWALDDPRVARRWLNAGIDVNDTEALAENIGDYFNDHTINIGDYMKNQDASYILGYDTNTIGELGNYLEDLYGYNFLADYAKAHNLDSGDLTAQMLARQLATTDSGLYMNPNEISDFLVKEGYLSPEERFSYTNEGSDLYSNYGGWMENSRAYGIPALDVYDSTVNGNFDDYVADSILSSLNQGLIDSGSTVRVGSSKAPSAKKAEKTE